MKTFDVEEEFAGGRILLRAPRTRERSGKAVAQRKKKVGARPTCEVRDFDFLARYCELGRGFIEYHRVGITVTATPDDQD